MLEKVIKLLKETSCFYDYRLNEFVIRKENTVAPENYATSGEVLKQFEDFLHKLEGYEQQLSRINNFLKEN